MTATVRKTAHPWRAWNPGALRATTAAPRSDLKQPRSVPPRTPK